MDTRMAFEMDLFVFVFYFDELYRTELRTLSASHVLYH